MSDWLALTAGTALLLATFCGWGALAARALAPRRAAAGAPPLPEPFDCAVLGAAALFAAGALVNFVLPLSATASDVAVGVGLAGCVAALARGGWRRRPAAIAALVALPLAAYVAWGVRRAPVGFDLGLYHLQHLLWLRTEPLPFGLAQLHDRLGLDSAWTTVTALAGGTRAHPDATYLVGAALSVAVLGALLVAARDALARRRLDFAARFALLAATLVLASGVHGLFSWFALSPSNDLPAALLALYALATGARLLAAGRDGARSAPALGLVAPFAASGALAMAVKLSQLPIALAVAAALAWRVLGASGSSERRAIGRAAALAAAVVAIWAAQNVALSGCLAYPRAATCFETLPWASEPRDTAALSAVVRAWARAPGPDFQEVAATGAWPRAWVERMLPERRLLHRLAAATLALAPLLLLARVATRRWPRAVAPPAAALWCAGAAAAGVAVCAVAAPDPRFAYGALVALAAAPFAALLPSLELTSARRARVAFGLAVATVVAAAAGGLLALPATQPEGAAWRRLPQPEHTLRRLPEGLAVRVPVGTEQCWALPLPCAPATGRELHAERRWGRWVFLRPEAARAAREAGGLGLHAQVAARWRLLGLEAGALLRLALDGALLALIAARGARWLVGADGSPLRRLLAAALVALTVVVAAATLLGATGRLSNGALAGVVRLLFAALFLPGLLRRGPRAWGRELAATAADPVAGAARALRASWRRRDGAGGARIERWLLAGIAAPLALFALLAVATQPLNWDAQSYRLARIALWLQEGSLAHLPTNDARLNYVGQSADLVMLWLVSYFRRAFPLVHLVQYVGGLLACLATVELGAQLGLSRRARLAAVAVLLGIPTVGLQFFTAQSDLFVAGALAAGLVFLLPALRSGRAGDWLLIGVGVGLALGAKGTVLYWGPGLLLLGLGWAASERAAWRRTFAGAALAFAATLALSGFNFVQNWRSYGNPFASEQAIALAHVVPPSPSTPAATAEESAAPASAQPARLGPRRTNGLAVLWQLLMPLSNPLLPASWLEPPFDALLDRLAESSVDYRRLRRSLAESGGWAAHGLSEDEASFGLIVPLLALLAGVGAARRATRHRAPDAVRWAAMALAVALFLVVFCAVSRMTWHQYRYFCMLAPFTSLLAVAALARARGLVRRAALAALVAGQLVVALHLGLASEYHGWRALVDARSSQYDFLWSEPAALLRELGERPLELGLALPRDSWIAPFVRGPVAHRVRLLTAEQLAAAGSLARLVEEVGLDAVVVAPELAPSIGPGLRALAAPRVEGRYRRLGFRRLRPGEVARPLVTWAIGVTSDGWTMPEALLQVASWSGPFELLVSNPAPFDRRIELASASGRIELSLPRGARRWLGVPVAGDDRVRLNVTPPFVPAEHRPPSGDPRSLGVELVPAAYAVDGVDSDGWTRTAATLQVENWLAGMVELDVVNPAPFARDVEIVSGVERVRSRLAAGAAGRLTVAVRPRDTVELAVSPPLPAATLPGAAADPRQLGLLLGGESRRRLTPPPR